LAEFEDYYTSGGAAVIIIKSCSSIDVASDAAVNQRQSPTTVRYQDREMTAAEREREIAGLKANNVEQGSALKTSGQVTFVATTGGRFVGCASALPNYGNTWCYLSELFVEKDYRGQGLGALLLRKIEASAARSGIQRIWTWTAGYQAPGFYERVGYTVFAQIQNYYQSRHARVGLRKELG
jgi:ribosomal protein S18 acetylase RimI-like enzyme